MNQHRTNPRHPSALAQAMIYWQAGRAIPLDLATRLIAEGYDVKALEDRHRQ